MKILRITQGDGDYPESLVNIHDPPKELFVLGNLENILNLPSLSVVGSRKVTPYGRATTSSLVKSIASKGVVIISGLALGVDAIAHQAAIDSGGKTIAVLACGLDKPHPSTNRGLARKILETGGALISEYPPEAPPLQHKFIERNRIVAGLGSGLLVTEAASKSGTLHTAGFALDQGKSVMAVPGNITSAQSQGTNNLIKAGAIPVTEPADVYHALKLDLKHKTNEVMASNDTEAIVLDLIKQGVSDSEQLQVMSELSPEKFNQTLTMMEITGKIRPLGAGSWCIAA